MARRKTEDTPEATPVEDAPDVVVTSEVPHLLVTHPRVQFVDGRATVDAETAAALATLPEDLGVTVQPAGEQDAGGEGDG